MISKASSSLLLTASIRANNQALWKWFLQNRHESRLASSTPAEQVPAPPSHPMTPQKSKKRYRIQTAILLNRSPILTRPPTAFEAAYQEYNARIARALSNPFPHDLYFKPGSVLETQFKREEKAREMAAFNWGKPRSWEEENSEDDAKSKANMGSPSRLSTIEEEENIMSRETEADRKGDVRSLNRKGDRNLYLLVKKAKERDEWKLPGGISNIQGGELLHEAAKRELRAECGVNMDTWIVGRHPIGVMDEQSFDADQFKGCKTFFFKAHILAGQVTPSAGSVADFAWLTRREIKKAVTPDYWANIQDIVSDF